MRKILASVAIAVLALSGLASPASAYRNVEDGDFVCEYYDDGPEASYLVIDKHVAAVLSTVDNKYFDSDGAICDELNFHTLEGAGGRYFKFIGICGSGEHLLYKAGDCSSTDYNLSYVIRTIEVSDLNDAVDRYEKYGYSYKNHSNSDNCMAFDGETFLVDPSVCAFWYDDSVGYYVY